MKILYSKLELKMFLTDADEENLNCSSNELKDIQILQDWVENVLHTEIDKRVLLKFLRSCENLEKAQEKITKFTNFKYDLKETFKDMHPRKFNLNSTITNDILLGYSKNLTKNNCRVVVAALPSSNASLLNTDNHLQFIAIATILRMHLDLNSVGDILIYDCGNLTLAHLKLLWRPTYWKIFLRGPSSFPFPIKELHLINLHKSLQSLVPFVVKKKICQRMVIHKEVDGLCKYLPSELIPRDFGGSGKSLKDLTIDVFNKMQEFHEIIEKFKG